MPSLLNRFSLPLLFTVKAVTNPVVFGAHAFARDREGRILLVRHSYLSGWLLPGGGVGRAEPPEEALIRELKEEVGYVRSAPPEFAQLYTRKVGWFTNLIAMYRVDDIEIDFKPNLEIREAKFFAPDALPDGVPGSTRKHIDELLGRTPFTAHW
jgi:8-oxo-dGTP pyrophosphatase MutT (NUDIX family)